MLRELHEVLRNGYPATNGGERLRFRTVDAFTIKDDISISSPLAFFDGYRCTLSGMARAQYLFT